MPNNTQPILKQDLSDGSTLKVHSIFLTIQGEGPFAGQPAVFVRLGGCNLQCPLCDTDYTTGSESMTVEEIVNTVMPILPPTRLVVITGGEPLRQNIKHLVNDLLGDAIRVQIETNGTLYQELPWFDPDFTVVCAPKTGQVNKNLLPHIKAFKYVIKAGDMDFDDGLPLHVLDHSASPKVARPPKGHPAVIYVQPADEQDEMRNATNLQACIWSAMNHGYTLCLQIHKIIGMD